MPHDKTVCIIGRCIDDIDGGGTREILKRAPYKTGNNPNGINMLNLNRMEWNLEKNLNWLKEAIDLEHHIRFVSNPMDPRNWFNSKGCHTILWHEFQLILSLTTKGDIYLNFGNYNQTVRQLANRKGRLL